MESAVAEVAAVAAAAKASFDAASPLGAALASARSGGMSLPALLDQARVWQDSGRAEAAAQLYETWLAHTASPLRHVAGFNWGTLLSAAGQSEGAENAYRLALEALPGFAPALLNLGHLHERRGDTATALSLWQQVFEADPLPSVDLQLHALNNSARLLETLRRYPEAEALMRRSLRLKAAQPAVIQH